MQVTSCDFHFDCPSHFYLLPAGDPHRSDEEQALIDRTWFTVSHEAEDELEADKVTSRRSSAATAKSSKSAKEEEADLFAWYEKKYGSAEKEKEKENARNVLVASRMSSSSAKRPSLTKSLSSKSIGPAAPGSGGTSAVSGSSSVAASRKRPLSALSRSESVERERERVPAARRQSVAASVKPALSVRGASPTNVTTAQRSVAPPPRTLRSSNAPVRVAVTTAASTLREKKKAAEKRAAVSATTATAAARRSSSAVPMSAVFSAPSATTSALSVGAARRAVVVARPSTRNAAATTTTTARAATPSSAASSAPATTGAAATAPSALAAHGVQFKSKIAQAKSKIPTSTAVAAKPPAKDDKSLELLLKQHNARFTPVPAYEPPRHSVRDVRKWEKQNAVKWSDLKPEDREKANEEISKHKAMGDW